MFRCTQSVNNRPRWGCEPAGPGSANQRSPPSHVVFLFTTGLRSRRGGCWEKVEQDQLIRPGVGSPNITPPHRHLLKMLRMNLKNFCSQAMKSLMLHQAYSSVQEKTESSNKATNRLLTSDLHGQRAEGFKGFSSSAGFYS